MKSFIVLTALLTALGCKGADYLIARTALTPAPELMETSLLVEVGKRDALSTVVYLTVENPTSQVVRDVKVLCSVSVLFQEKTVVDEPLRGVIRGKSKVRLAVPADQVLNAMTCRTLTNV